MAHQNSSSDDNENILLEQYKLYVEMADRISSRRGETNKFYVSLLTGLFTILTIFDTSLASQKYLVLGISVLGFSLCLPWIITIRSFKQINSVKFKIINEMEKKLPFSCYAREWEVLTESKKKVYFRFTDIEFYIPLLVALMFVALFIYTALK